MKLSRDHLRVLEAIYFCRPFSFLPDVDVDGVWVELMEMGMMEWCRDGNGVDCVGPTPLGMEHLGRWLTVKRLGRG